MPKGLHRFQNILGIRLQINFDNRVVNISGRWTDETLYHQIETRLGIEPNPISKSVTDPYSTEEALKCSL